MFNDRILTPALLVNVMDELLGIFGNKWNHVSIRGLVETNVTLVVKWSSDHNNTEKEVEELFNEAIERGFVCKLS